MEVALDRLTPRGEPFGWRTVDDRIVVGWVAPSAAWAREVKLAAVDAVRAPALEPGRRQSFVAGRALLGRLLLELFPGSTAWSVDTAPCPGCGAGHGPAVVRGVPALVSVAHTHGLVVAAVAPTSRVGRLGVDVVPAPEGSSRSPGIQAVAKAGGHGLRLEPGLLRPGPGTCRVEGASTTYLVRDLAVPGGGYALTVAWTLAARPLRE